MVSFSSTIVLRVYFIIDRIVYACARELTFVPIFKAIFKDTFINLKQSIEIICFYFSRKKKLITTREKKIVHNSTLKFRLVRALCVGMYPFLINLLLFSCCYATIFFFRHSLSLSRSVSLHTNYTMK